MPIPHVNAILIPERFTSAVLAAYALDWLRDQPNTIILGGTPANEHEQKLMTDAIQFALNGLKVEGVIA
jgi:hypothetical protein